ncbi:hypothetical protein SLS58_010905 [Diplodia intermedia]|uniref:Uncharacterized protein n=1 Tax=Diplodia intermedia TaxID=856260 RepID=A0ABR3T2V4_9PEZI
MSLSTIDSHSLRKSMASRSEPSSRRLTLSTLALAATILTIVTTVVWRADERWYSSAKSRRVLLSLYSVPLFLASLLTVVTYGLAQSHVNHVKPEDSGASSDFMAGKFAVWALSTLTQVIFIVAAMRWLPLASDMDLSRSSTENRSQEMRHQAPPMMIELKGEQPGGDLASPTFSTDTLSRNSWRSSLQQVVRPITSRTRLLSRTSSLRKSGSFYSGNTTRTNSIAPSDGFESWDTSSVDQQARDIATQSADVLQQDLLRVLGPGRGGTRLDPIPGSRPVSPARALDGPFPPPPLTLDINLDDLPAPAPAFMAGSPHSSRPSTPTSMTPSTAGVEDANVHPLFRSDSPHPPPAASPGTVVVASPFSGHVIARPSRSRANSRTRGGVASPAPGGTYYDGVANSIRSNASMRSLRSPSPPAREITPPVPDFIFSNGDSPRVSSASLRKVSLHKDGGGES